MENMYISDWKLWEKQVNQSLKHEAKMFGKGQTMFKPQSKIQAENDRAKVDYNFQSKNDIPHADPSSIKRHRKKKAVRTGRNTKRATPKKKTTRRKSKGLKKKTKDTELKNSVKNNSSKEKLL